MGFQVALAMRIQTVVFHVMTVVVMQVVTRVLGDHHYVHLEYDTTSVASSYQFFRGTFIFMWCYNLEKHK
jgi:hypothetical protein